MSTPVSMQAIERTTESLSYFLKTATYARSGASSYSVNTLLNNFSGLKIQLGWPDNLDALDLPTLALVYNSKDNIQEGYGNHLDSSVLDYSLFGFVGRQESHGDNLKLRDKLNQDTESLIEGSDYINLYEAPDFSTTAGDIAVMEVVSSPLPPSDEAVEARYQFVIDFKVEYMKKI